MSDTPVNKPIDWNKIGSPTCDTGAQTEALRAMGLDDKARPINGVGPNYSQIIRLMPQLVTRDANGRGAWNSPLIDVAALTTIKEKEVSKDRFDGMGADAEVHDVEIQATVIAIAQLARVRVVADQSRTAGSVPIVVTNEQIIAEMQNLTLAEIRTAADAAFCKIKGLTPAVCEVGRATAPFANGLSSNTPSPRR